MFLWPQEREHADDAAEAHANSRAGILGRQHTPQLHLAVREPWALKTDVDEGRLDRPSRRKTHHVRDDVADARGAHGCQAQVEAHGGVNKVAGKDHDEIVHEAKADHRQTGEHG